MKDIATIRLEQGAAYPYDHDGEGDPPPATDWAEAAARGVLADLCDRRGIKWALRDEEIDEETQQEIVASLANIIRAAAAEARP